MSLERSRAWVRHWMNIHGKRDVLAESLRKDEYWADSIWREDGSHRSDWRHLAQWSGEARGLSTALLLGDFE